jgi:phenylacetate-CoA ligase
MTRKHSGAAAGEVSTLPIFHNVLDWDDLFATYPVPDVFERTVYRWSPDRIRQLQSERFLDLIELGWQNPFYSRRWADAGLGPGDIRSLEDIVHLPIFTSEDIKNDQLENPPFGLIHSGAMALRGKVPLKVHTSGGTTGKPRPTLYGPLEWELNGLTFARGTYIQGGRPGDVHQIPATNSLANFGWCVYKASHDYLGIIPLTTGSGVVTPSRRQLELAFDWGTTIWTSFPEYLTQLAKVARDELGRDVRELKTKFIQSFLGPDTDNSLRKQLEELWGCPVYDHYGAHEQGLGAFECRHKAGLHFMEDTCYFEVLDLETKRPVPKGQSGNLVVTILFRSIPPIIRMNVQDVGRILHEDRCECGSCFRRMDKFLGRSDSMVKLRGTNVFPMACLPGVMSDPRTIGEWICVVDRTENDGVLRDEMTIRVEVRNDAPTRDGLQAHLERRFHSDLGVRVAVELVDQGSLAEIANLGREGKPRRLLDRRFAKR